MAAPNSTYDKETTDDDLRHLTGIDADEERRIEEAAHRPGKGLNDLEQSAGGSTSGGEQSPEELQDAEENSSPGGIIGRGFEDSYDHAKEKAKEAIRQRLFRKVRTTFTPKRVAIGGGLLSFLIILLIMASGFSAFELINLRENALGHGNRYTNKVLQIRRARTLGKMLNKMTDEKVPEAERQRYKDAFSKHGFKVDFDAEGKLKEFGFTSKDGKYTKFDIEEKDTIKSTNKFFGGTGVGLEASQALDKVNSNVGGLWRGPGARVVYGAYRFAFFNWLDKSNSKDAKTPSDKLAEDLRAANTTEEAMTAQGTQTKQQLGDGEQTKDGKQTSAISGDEVLAGELNGNISSADYENALLKDPTKGSELLGVKASDVEDLVDGTSTGLKAGGLKEAVLSKLGNGAFFKGNPLQLAKAANILGIDQEACEIKGILNFVSNVRNVMLSIELARFAVRMLNAADDQKAGILSSEGLNLLMIYLNYPNPKNGKGMTAAGGILNMQGQTEQRPSKINLSLWGTGRNNDGILGEVNSWISGIPGASNNCKIVNNGFVSAGGFAVGIIAAIGSGGGITAADVATLVTLLAVHAVVVQVATPLLIETGAHLVLNGQEKNGEMVGDAFASGMGSLGAMVGSATGFRPSTQKQLAALDPQINADEHAQIAQESLYTRYISPSNGDSLASRVAVSLPTSFRGFAMSFTGSMAGVLRNLTSFGMLKNFLPGTSRDALAAAGDNGCTDPQIVAHHIAATAFCAPIMANTPDVDIDATKAILTQYQQIDASGAPTDTKQGDNNKSFQEYIDDCMSGRPGVLYNGHPDKNGNDSIIDDTCVDAGPPLPGDTIGRYDRFAAWFGCRNDEQSINEQIGIVSPTVTVCGQVSGSAPQDQQNVETKTLQ